MKRRINVELGRIRFDELETCGPNDLQVMHIQINFKHIHVNNWYEQPDNILELRRHEQLSKMPPLDAPLQASTSMYLTYVGCVSNGHDNDKISALVVITITANVHWGLVTLKFCLEAVFDVNNNSGKLYYQLCVKNHLLIYHLMFYCCIV